MKSLTEIVLCILDDIGMLCGVNPSRDALTITRRVEDEGQSFLTITLPSFSVALESALRDGYWSPSHAPSFRKRSTSCLPRFLGGFIDQIFDAEGLLLSCPSLSAIRSIRQICRAVGKLFLVCSEERTRNAGRKFAELDDSLERAEIPIQLDTIFNYVSRVVWSDIVGSCSYERFYSDIIPRHGPGTTAEGVRGNAKYVFPSWPQRLERCFPFTEFGISSILNSDANERVSQVQDFLPRDETPVKVCFVPKTASKPRVIAIEPVAMQYMQQAIADWIRPRIEMHCRYTAGHVNFRDQTVNSKFARSASRDGVYATLDMSDASDRVSCKRVWSMLQSVPDFRRCVFATRSTRASIPGGLVRPLRKFASMGSAMCFPIEAMAFYIAIISSRIAHSGRRPTPREIYLASREIYVYGDDLIVPANETPSIISTLESFGFKVNTDKSFWTGKFRESCGSDYYDGEDVTPVYLRRMPPSDRADVIGVVSLTSFANQCYWIGLWGTAKYLRQQVEKLVGKLPSVDIRTQALGWNSFSNAISTHGWHKDYQRLKSRLLVPTPIRSADPLDGDAALLKCWRLIGIPFSPVSLDHLLTTVRFGNLALKRRWI